MKKIIFLFFFLSGLLLLSSCKKEFLEKAPGVDLTEDNAFANKASLETFMATIYKYAVHSNFRYRDQNNFSTTVTVSATDVVHPTSDFTDEGDASEATFINTNQWNQGNVLPTNIVTIEDYRYYIRWIALRQINIVLKRVNEVPDADQSYKNQITAEVKVLRAMNYFEMVKRYGGVPVVDQVFEPGVPVNVPRSSFDDCIKFILKDCDDAIASNDLPPSYSASLRGRITKVVAYTVKSKVLLYAASPIFNTATPYLSMANSADNKLIGYGNYDVNRWKTAADAAKAALDYALANGYALIDDVTKRNPVDPLNGTVAPIGNYRNSWEQYNNTEIILNYQGTAAAALAFGNTYSLYNPRCYGGNWSGVTMPLNFLKKYEKLDGTAQTWDAAGGNDLLSKYGQLDPRFKQTVCYTNSYFNSAHPISQIYNGGVHYVDCKGGIWIRKSIQGNANISATVQNDIIFRLNELYLNYAEALNEFNAAPPPEAYTAVNTIRSRSAMPNFPPGLTQDQFRQKLRNEIAIEMCFDDHRMWDIRRWMIAENDGVMKGSLMGLQINRVGTAPNYTYTWLPYLIETRSFSVRMYLHPFPQNEVLKGNLIQNPGY